MLHSSKPTLPAILAVLTGLLPACWLLRLAAAWSGDVSLAAVATLLAQFDAHAIALLLGVIALARLPQTSTEAMRSQAG